MRSDGGHPLSLDDVQVHLVETTAEAAEFMRWVGERRPGNKLAYDTESGGLDKQKHFARLAQFGDSRQGWALSVEHWKGTIQEVFDTFDGDYITANGPFDWAMSTNAGIRMPPTSRVHDIRPMHHPLDPTFSTGLKPLATKYVDPRASQAQHDLDEAIKVYGWDGVPIDFAPYWIYAAQDTVLTNQLDDVLRPRMLEQCPKAYDLELGTIWVTDAMERRGAHVDIPYAKDSLERFNEYVRTSEQWCHDQYGVSPGSNQAVINVLVEEGFDFTQKTDTGLFKLDKDVLAEIDHPLAATVLRRRQTQKLAQSYLRHFIEKSDDDDVVHYSINTLGARTSRMTIKNPAFQTLPRFSEKNAAAIRIRNCISARPEHTLLMCDFDQIEMRVLAYLSKDPGMRDAFLAAYDDPEMDFFISMACRIYQIPTMAKSDPRRTLTKSTCYGLAYGAGIAKLIETSGARPDDVKAFMQSFNAMFSEVPRFIRGVERDAFASREREGVASVYSPLTNRRHVGDRYKEYALVNYLIQGSAAELFKMKLLQIDAAGLGPWMILPVHDEVILDVPNEHVPDAVDALEKIMNDNDMLAPIPLTASVSYGKRWGKKRGWNGIEEWATFTGSPEEI